MIRLEADDQLLVKDLGRFVEPVEITGVSGKLLGLFVPANLQGKQLYARLAAQIDWPEMARRRQYQGRCYTSAEVMSHMKMLEQECDRRKAAGEKEFTPDEAVAFLDAIRKSEQGKADLAG